MAAKFRDYYEVLDIARTATDEEVKLAYRKLARKHHPDLHPEKEKELHTAKMQEVNEAYAVLGAKEHRAKYDQYGEHWKDGPPPPPRSSKRSSSSGDYESAGAPQGDPEGFSDFFSSMFRQGRSQASAEDLAPSELDVEAVLELSLHDAVNGVEKTFSLLTTGLCQNCRGTGRVKNGFCPVCGGIGEIRKPRDIKTRIPAGLVEGSRIRLKGQGNEGARGRGDLYLQIRLTPDPRYKIDRNNLETALRILPWQAALGSQANVETLDGPVKIKIAKGTHSGKRLRLTGKGLGKAGNRGDFFIRIEIDMADTLSAKAEALYKQLEDENA
jgi:curved DNA-binding protein